jgi:hypothetical protein
MIITGIGPQPLEPNADLSPDNQSCSHMSISQANAQTPEASLRQSLEALEPEPWTEPRLAINLQQKLLGMTEVGPGDSAMLNGHCDIVPQIVRRCFDFSSARPPRSM